VKRAGKPVQKGNQRGWKGYSITKSRRKIKEKTIETNAKKRTRSKGRGLKTNGKKKLLLGAGRASVGWYKNWRRKKKKKKTDAGWGKNRL